MYHHLAMNFGGRGLQFPGRPPLRNAPVGLSTALLRVRSRTNCPRKARGPRVSSKGSCGWAESETLAETRGEGEKVLLDPSAPAGEAGGEGRGVSASIPSSAEGGRGGFGTSVSTDRMGQGGELWEGCGDGLSVCVPARGPASPRGTRGLLSQELEGKFALTSRCQPAPRTPAAGASPPFSEEG